MGSAICVTVLSLCLNVFHTMASTNTCSENQDPHIRVEGAPTAEALLNLREEVLSRPSPGAITKSAQEVQMNRSDLSRLLAPATIRKVADLERKLR